MSVSELIRKWDKRVKIAAYRAARVAHGALLPKDEKDTIVKIQRYIFSLGMCPITLGSAGPLRMPQPTGGDTRLHNAPDAMFRPTRMWSNAPCPNFVILHSVIVAHIDMSIGGPLDAWLDYEVGAPTMTPANYASVDGRYTGFIPDGFIGGITFEFSAGFSGPGSIGVSV